MVESAANSNTNSGPEEAKATVTNTPLMASLNLSKFLLDPQIGEAYTRKEEVLKHHDYSRTLWGEDKIRTLEDLQNELEMEGLDGLEAREGEDFSDDEEDSKLNQDKDDQHQYRKPTGNIARSGEAGDLKGMSVAELHEIIDS